MLDYRTFVLYNRASERQANIADIDDLNRRWIYLMPQRNELIHSSSSTSSLFICGKAIRSYSIRETNIYKPQNSLTYLSCQSMGGFEPDLNGFCKRKFPKGKPQLNGFSTSIKGTAYFTHFLKGSEVVSLSRRQHSREGRVDPGGAFELDSNRSNTAVNQEKILFQYKNLPPLHGTAHLSKLIICFYPINFWFAHDYGGFADSTSSRV